MFDEKSPYQGLETASLYKTDASGRAALYLYKRRRILPRLDAQVTLLEHQVSEGDRLDNITTRYLADPLQAYRVYDANLLLHPQELLLSARRRVRIAMPGL